MAGGVRSLLAFWSGGAANSGAPPATQGGVRSLLAFWSGGAANSGAAPTTPGGFRSLLAFWAGGAANSGTTPPVVIPDVYPGAGHPVGIWWGERKIKRGKRLDSILRLAMEQLLGTAPAIPASSPAARAVKIVQPFVASGRIDWKAVESSPSKVKELLTLWQEQADSLEDEEILLMLMA